MIPWRGIVPMAVTWDGADFLGEVLGPPGVCMQMPFGRCALSVGFTPLGRRAGLLLLFCPRWSLSICLGFVLSGLKTVGGTPWGVFFVSGVSNTFRGIVQRLVLLPPTKGDMVLF